MTARKKSRMQWYRADLHIHTPASGDYFDTSASYIDILRKADQRGIDIIAITDHNTVNGYASIGREVEQLTYLESLGRAQADELRLLAEYRRLLDKILVLPGFEFTATFGFHVLGIFSPQMTVRELELLLLSLNIPASALDEGGMEVGASADVLTAYRTINEAGGICIAAHVNAAHGVAMRGLDFGGQTRIAYTQDRHLHALEATDLDRKGRNTQRFFDGTKPEYPRRMRCIQGSDAHSVNTVREGRNIRYGVGERATEVSLPELTFAALLTVFRTSDFSQSRPYTPDHRPEDYVQVARREGPSMVQSFHESTKRQGGHFNNIIVDICAFANTNGGAIYIGVSPDARVKPVGVADVPETIAALQTEIAALISPTLNVDIDTLETGGKTVIRVQVPLGEDRPYAMDNTKIYVRGEDDTSLAIRDEIVNLVQQGLGSRAVAPPTLPLPTPTAPPVENVAPVVPPTPPETAPIVDEEGDPPRSGVEIVGVETRGDTRYYIMRDLRNGNIVKNVTKSSARRLWHYAISQKETNPVQTDQVEWNGNVGLWRTYEHMGALHYDLVQRSDKGVQVYYGATESGMHGLWQQFLLPED